MSASISVVRFGRLVAATVCFVVSRPVIAEVSLPNIFSDHMVIQQKQKNRVWGKAAAGEKVTVTIGGQSHAATAAPDGAWQVVLEPLEVGKPLELVVAGASNNIKISDVLVGEVWICSGQSNMEFAMRNSDDFDLERLTAKYPEIRTINFPNVGSQEPVWTHANTNWIVCSPDNVRSFSAVGYYFARQIHQSVGVPVGLINNAWAGSRAESWIPREEFTGKENLMPIVERYDAFAKELSELEAKPNLTDAERRRARQLRTDVFGDDRPANSFNGIVASHTGYGIRGVIWYQGEGNAPRAYQHRELLPLLIESWRKKWGQGDFPFYWVQLPNYQASAYKPDPSDSEWAELRESQTMTLGKLANTGQAVTIDVGDGRDLHPRNKEDVGFRLARWALARDYGFDIPYQSPMFKSVSFENGKARLTFEHVNRMLRTINDPTPLGFAIAGEDRQFVWANATINPDGTIMVSSDRVSKPVAVRYAWSDNPVCNIYDAAGLPLTPFRTDDWPGLTKDAR